MKQGRIYLIGAGPGDPGLITVRGLECLRQAEVVVYDYLANPQLLEEAPSAEKIYVGKCRGHHHRPQEEINRLLVELGQAGKIVARLKGGDPYLFGRGGEEALCLHEVGIPFEVVPGVTAAFAAAAYSGIPLTHRDFTTSLGLITGHEDPAKKVSRLDWEKLAQGIGTLVFYMGMANLELIARELITHGRDPQTPVAVVRWATHPSQQTLISTLAEVSHEVVRQKFAPPAVIIIGEVVTLRNELRWFDNRPLFGKRVLVTRSAEQAGSFSRLLQEQGAQVIECPTIALVPPESWDELDTLLAEVDRHDWLLLTSANAVRTVFERLAAAGRDARALGRCRVCVVGPKSAAILAEYGIRADLIPEDYKGEGVVAAFEKIGVRGARILFPRADKARKVIPEGLTALGAEVTAPIAYRNVVPKALPETAREALTAGKIDVITFTSSSTVENLAALLGVASLTESLAGVTVASIGPITSTTCRRFGLTVDLEPEDYTLESLTAALILHTSCA